MPVLMTCPSRSTDLVEVVGQIMGGKLDPVMYLRSYNPEANDGRGEICWTPIRALAVRFTSLSEAMEAWRATPESRPFRDDGGRNRPLTAFTVTFETVPE